MDSNGTPLVYIQPGRTDPGESDTRLPWYFTVILAAAVLSVFLAYLLVELKQNGRPGFPLDDPWIHLTFARNIARGWGFVFNQGEPVAGSTAPLWTVVLAFFHLFTRSGSAMVVIAKALGAVFFYIGALYACRMATFLTRSRWAGLAAGLAIVTLSHFGWAMMSGMEVGLSVCLTLAGMYYHAVPQKGWKRLLPWILLGLAVHARPESAVLVGFLALDVLVRRLGFRQRRMFWRGLAVYAVAVAPYFILNLVLSGSPLPQTYAAKAGQSSLIAALATWDIARLQVLLFRTPWAYFAGFAVHLWRANPVIAILVPVGLAVLIGQAVRLRRDTGFLVPLTALGYVPLMGLTVPLMGPAFQSGRYIGNVTALTVVVAACGGALVMGRLRSRAVRAGIGVVLTALVTCNAVVTGIASAGYTARADSSINRMQVALGEWLAEETPPDAVLACNDVGAIGYLSGRRILDLAGLVSPDVLSHLRKQRTWGQGHLEYFMDRKPDYIIVFPDLYPALRNAPFARPCAYAEVKDNYASQFNFRPRVRTLAGILAVRVEVDPRPSVMVVFECDWARDVSGGTGAGSADSTASP